MDIQQNNGKQGVRTRHIDIRLTENEYEMIVEKAAECGLTLSNYRMHEPTLSAFRMYSKVNLMRLKNDISEMRIICVLG